MRAIVAEAFGGYQNLKLADIPKPAVSDGRVLVRMTAAGVTPLDHTILSGGHPRAKAPLVLGNANQASTGRAFSKKTCNETRRPRR
jgi:NADPH:quinone reductase